MGPTGSASLPAAAAASIVFPNADLPGIACVMVVADLMAHYTDGVTAGGGVVWLAPDSVTIEALGSDISDDL